jgi:hypothetical protein
LDDCLLSLGQWCFVLLDHDTVVRRLGLDGLDDQRIAALLKKLASDATNVQNVAAAATTLRQWDQRLLFAREGQEPCPH